VVNFFFPIFFCGGQAESTPIENVVYPRVGGLGFPGP
jgi:hypothetical protein